jgi:hypothetical protein
VSSRKLPIRRLCFISWWSYTTKRLSCAHVKVKVIVITVTDSTIPCPNYGHGEQSTRSISISLSISIGMFGFTVYVSRFQSKRAAEPCSLARMEQFLKSFSDLCITKKQLRVPVSDLVRHFTLGVCCREGGCSNYVWSTDN